MYISSRIPQSLEKRFHQKCLGNFAQFFVLFSFYEVRYDAAAKVYFVANVCLPPGGEYSQCGLTGGPVGLRVLLNGYQMALFVNQILPIGDILRFLATYYVSTRYAHPDANLVIILIINEF